MINLITAKHAKEITKHLIIDEDIMNSIFSQIRYACEDGETHIYSANLDKLMLKYLNDLGYSINGHENGLYKIKW